MKEGNQSRKEATHLKFFTPRNPVRFGTWNVRTMYEMGKTAIMANEMDNYGLQLLGLSEVRWNSSGVVKLATGQQILFSGHEKEDAPRTEGVALMLAKDAQKDLISWNPVSSRIMTANFNTLYKNIKMRVIQIYAPMTQRIK